MTLLVWSRVCNNEITAIPSNFPPYFNSNCDAKLQGLEFEDDIVIISKCLMSFK